MSHGLRGRWLWSAYIMAAGCPRASAAEDLTLRCQVCQVLILKVKLRGLKLSMQEGVMADGSSAFDAEFKEQARSYRSGKVVDDTLCSDASLGDWQVHADKIRAEPRVMRKECQKMLEDYQGELEAISRLDDQEAELREKFCMKRRKHDRRFCEALWASPELVPEKPEKEVDGMSGETVQNSDEL
eukprot:TRINITY_DN124577_c0_g1_i1.p1 TRINITY_DN124577_c0_g1~~TRINITY_DN124577_c0_g1_i1.p1  ORF type:complete len:185 (+),score=27.57 TRINITY_DN124577_c0_g1_i1:113-667(+)